MISQLAKTKRVLVLVDRANTDMSAKSFNRQTDLIKLRDYLADSNEGRELIEMAIYVGLPPIRERFQTQRKRAEGFINWAKSEGFMVVTKEGKPKGDRYEADVDVVMAMDAIELSLEIEPDIVVLVTGDSDFAYLAEKLRRRGIRVEVASVEQSLGNELKLAANSVIDLLAIFDELKPNDPDEDYYRIGHDSIFD